MPGVAQDRGPAPRNGISAIRDRLLILDPRAAETRRAPELLHRRAEGSGFLKEDAVAGKHQFGQLEPIRRPYSHSTMIGDGLGGGATIRNLGLVSGTGSPGIGGDADA